MTPEQIAAMNAAATLIERIGTWPVGTVLVFLVLSPWFAMLWVTHNQKKQIDEYRKETEVQMAESAKIADQQTREFRQMYENNVKLVEGFLRVSKDLHETVVLNVRILTEVKDIALNNQICPIVRENGRTR